MKNLFKHGVAIALLSHSINAKESNPENNYPRLGTTTVIKAVLAQKLISDYVGSFRAYVSHDVYDTQWNYVLIPTGSVIHGKVIRLANVNEPINARVAYLIKSIERPDDVVIDMSRDSAVDHEGVGGIKDEVNYHFFAQFMGVMAYAIVSSGADGKQTGGITGKVDTKAEVANSARTQVQPLAAKYLKLVPTITINSGKTFNIFIEKSRRIKPFRSVFHEFIN